jgi:hypothetical protein
MTSTLSPTTSSHYMNSSLTTHYKRRVLLKRSTQQINDPEVIQQIKGLKMKKSVKFEQETDQLEKIRYFYKTQSPISVQQGDPPIMISSCEDYKLSQPNWPSRNSIFYNTEQKIRMENVNLIDGDYQHMESNQLVIEGRCRALNLSFHKIVSIRYTFDLWRTYHETTGEFKESIASTSNTWDRFSFHIPMDCKKQQQSLYLALRYTVDDQEFWDNNSGMNYEVVMTPEQHIENDEEEQQEQEQDVEEQPELIHHEDEEELAQMMMTTQKKDNTKILGRRYDFTASLSAAAAARKPYSPPPSPPGTPIDTEDNFSYTPPVFFGNTEQQPELTYIVESTTIKKTEPIPINNPISAEGFQMSYSDFVNKYCFYNSHSNPIYSSTLSTSPSAVLS